MASADVVVSASRWETFGIAIAEAMGLGLPVIATATAGATHLISDGSTGFLVPIDDEQALSDKLIEVIGDPMIHTQIRPLAKQRVAELDVPIISQRYRALMNLLGEKKRP
jgi:glycosyltransferase involved in cell wall biosynthesis